MSLYKPTSGISNSHEAVLWNVQNWIYICILPGRW